MIETFKSKKNKKISTKSNFEIRFVYQKFKFQSTLFVDNNSQQQFCGNSGNSNPNRIYTIDMIKYGLYHR